MALVVLPRRPSSRWLWVSLLRGVRDMAKRAGLLGLLGVVRCAVLTSHGVKQAREPGRHPRGLHPPIEAVYSSPITAARRPGSSWISGSRNSTTTGGPDAPLSGNNVAAKIRPEHGIQEWFGSASFDHPRPATTDVPEVPVSRRRRGLRVSRRTLPAGRHWPSCRTVWPWHCEPSSPGVTPTAPALWCCAPMPPSSSCWAALRTGQMPETIEAEDFRAFTCGLSVYRRKSDGESERGDDRGSPSAVSGQVNPTFLDVVGCPHV